MSIENTTFKDILFDAMKNEGFDITKIPETGNKMWLAFSKALKLFLNQNVTVVIDPNQLVANLNQPEDPVSQSSLQAGTDPVLQVNGEIRTPNVNGMELKGKLI